MSLCTELHGHPHPHRHPLMADVCVYFTITLASFVFGQSLRIEAIVKPLARQSPDDDIVIVLAAVEAIALFTVAFSVGTSVIQIRATVFTQARHSYAAFVWVLAIVGAVVIVTVCSIVAARRGNSHESFTPT